MAYEVLITDPAIQDLKKLPAHLIQRMKRAVLELATEPRPPNCRKLASVDPPTWRIRVGDWRVLYQVDDRKKLVAVIHFYHRREAYR